jgi:biotin carboxyl carrier protein
VLRAVGSGFRNNPGPPAVRRYTAGDTELAVGYRLGRFPLFTVTVTVTGAGGSGAGGSGAGAGGSGAGGSGAAGSGAGGSGAGGSGAGGSGAGGSGAGGSGAAGAGGDASVGAGSSGGPGSVDGPGPADDGDRLAVTLLEARADAVELVVDGVRRRFDVRRYQPRGSGGVQRDGLVHVDSALGSAVLRPVDRFPDKDAQRPSGSLVAPMPGTVVKVLAAPGDRVLKGDPVVVIEAMKMEHTIGAAADGTVAEILVEVGRQVDIDQVIAVITGISDDAGEESGGEPSGG